MDGKTLTWFSFDAPYVSPEAVFGAHFGHREADAFFWDDGSELTVGLGAAAVAVGEGGARWRRIRREAASIFRRLHPLRPDSMDPRPRLFGGIGFRDDLHEDADADEAAEARFVLPRWTYRIGPHGAARASIVLPSSTTASGRRRAVEQIRRRLAQADRTGPARASGTAPRELRVASPDADRWRADVHSALAEIESGRLRKVVAARPFDVSFDEPPSPAAVLRALARDQDGTAGAVRFAFRRGARTFLGLTPERLVHVRGRQVRTEALAGTAPAGPGDGARLLASRKDAHEHRLVVEDIASRLRPLCTRLLHDTSPRLRASSGVQHLLTPIEGELARPLHVLDVARRLHPTPAVCGLPSCAAARWIAAHEEADRGWYSGAVGHFDAAGRGELRVALRCADLAGNHARVWAGAGLVAGSDPDDELRELGLKAATMLGAFARAADREPNTPVHLPFTRPA